MWKSPALEYVENDATDDGDQADQCDDAGNRASRALRRKSACLVRKTKRQRKPRHDHARTEQLTWIPSAKHRSNHRPARRHKRQPQCYPAVHRNLTPVIARRPNRTRHADLSQGLRLQYTTGIANRPLHQSREANDSRVFESHRIACYGNNGVQLLDNFGINLVCRNKTGQFVVIGLSKRNR